MKNTVVISAYIISSCTLMNIEKILYFLKSKIVFVLSPNFFREVNENLISANSASPLFSP